MNQMAQVPEWVAYIVAALVLAGALLACIGSFGMVRLRNFYQRVHAPTMGATLGAGCLLVASMLYFSVAQTRPVIHELLITFFAVTTTAVTFLLLVRSALYRDRVAGRDRIPGANDTNAVTGKEED
ncbi:MAG: monovalent cation/H(+) antiporter subunit G [Corticimicrobacter sp.]|uniref:monovalent cation/H(+) antiporter subunit G n=1 Tax=Corticimicrobacter sp. TaxID=2678536 RepID=UPI0032DA4891